MKHRIPLTKSLLLFLPVPISSGGCTTPTYAKVLFSFQYKTSITFLKGLQESIQYLHGYKYRTQTERDLQEAEVEQLTTNHNCLTNLPELQPKGIFSKEIDRILNSMSSIIDAVNTLRNRGSVAHPNERLLSAEAALLCIKSIRTLFQFLDSKLRTNKTK